MKYPTKGPGDLPPFEPADSIWDDDVWVEEQVTELRKEWVDEAQMLLVDYMYGGMDDATVLASITAITGRLIEKIEKRAEASRYPPD